MRPSIDDDDDDDDDKTTGTEQLLDKIKSKDNNLNPEISDQHGGVDGVGATFVHRLASGFSCAVIGQWIWLCFAWPIFRYFFFYWTNFPPIMTYIVGMIGHGVLFVMLPKPLEHKPSRLAAVNQATLPVILSGLRVFCWDDQDPALKFFLIIAAVFGLS